MAIDHAKSSTESRTFCDALLKTLQRLEPGTVRFETSNCGFAANGSNRFAYLYHKADTSVATIYLRSDEPSLIPQLSNGSRVEIREKLTGNWAREFPTFIQLPLGSNAEEVAELLLTYSLPLAAKKRGTKIARERTNDVEVQEGKVRTVLATRYERSRTLRAICLNHHGYKCAGCDLIMEERYGKLAKFMIHVHHLERLADAGERIVDPVRDTIPLCPNCHSVVHLATPPLSVQTLRSIFVR